MKEKEPPTQQLPWRTIEDVCRILGEERARREGKPLSEATPVPRGTVYGHIRRYGTPDSPYRKAHLRIPNSDPNAEIYKRNLFPLPVPGHKPLTWVPDEGKGETLADVDEKFRTWDRNRPGRGSKTRGADTRRKCPDGCTCGRHKPRPRRQASADGGA